MQTPKQLFAPTTEGVIRDTVPLRSNIQTVTPSMSVTDQRVVMTNFNDAHSELEFINSAALERCLDQQAVITATVANMVI